MHSEFKFIVIKVIQMVAALINEEAVFILGQTILKPRMRKIPKEGVGTVNKSPWEKSFNEDWQIIRLNWNLFECKSPLTAGKGSSSPPSFGQEWSKRTVKQPAQLFLVWDEAQRKESRCGN